MASEGIVAVVKIKLNGWFIGVLWTEVDAVEVSGGGEKRCGVCGTGWPRAAAISAKRVRVLSWKSGPRVRTISLIRHLNEDGGVTEKNIRFINNDPFNVLKSHFGFRALG